MIVRKPIDWVQAAPAILEALPKGILLSTQNGEKMDTMTIGWGTLGLDWYQPIFTVFVRDSRYTKELLDQTGVFTVNAGLPGQDVKTIVSHCGTLSGRDHDKFAELGLQVIEGEKVKAPAIVQMPLTLECEVIYAQRQDENAIEPDLKARYYPQGDFHTAYTGRIVAAYVLEEKDS